MATEKMIKGRRCRSYNGVWVSADGNCVEVDTIWKTGFSEIPTTKPAKVHTDKNGEKYVKRKMRNSFYNVYIKDAVYACFCPPMRAMYEGPKPASKDPTFGPVCAKRALSAAIVRSQTR